jgi:tetratricopeptide (TPR) repeat protein
MNDCALRPLLIVLWLNISFAGAARCLEMKEQQQIKLVLTSYEQGNYIQARDLALRAISKTPSNLTLHYLLGNAYAKLGQIDLARSQYTFCCQNQGTKNEQVYQYAQKALLQLTDWAKSQPSKPPQDNGAGDLPAAGTKPAASRQVTERLKRFHDEGAQAIETRKRALDMQIRAVQLDTAEAISQVPQVNAQGFLNPFYDSTVASLREQENAKIVALSDAFEVEKKRITEIYDREARDFEASQNAQSGPEKRTLH